MQRKSPYGVVLSEEEWTELTKRANKYTLTYFAFSRAKMILLASRGVSNGEIASRLDTPHKVVSMWQKRFLKNASLDLKSEPIRDPPDLPPRKIIVQVKV
jgi:hypothetical protein